MASLGQIFDASSVDPTSGYDVLPPAKYLAQIVNSEMRATKDGLGQYLFLEVDVIDGPYAWRKLFDRLRALATACIGSVDSSAPSSPRRSNVSCSSSSPEIETYRFSRRKMS